MAPLMHGDADFLTGGGELGSLMRAHGWAATPLGPPAGWPEGLRSTLGLCLDSAFPIAIYWGPELALLYNDAWRPILGDKHPWGLGRAAREVWPEIWDEIEPVFAQVRASGKGVFKGDSLLPMNRFGYVEECYFDYTFNPIRSGDAVAGIFNVVIETTYRVIAARRARTQRDFAARLAPSKGLADVLDLAADCLAESAIDVPFALLYRLGEDGRTARLVRAVGLAPGHAAAPAEVALDGADPWRLGAAAHDGRPVHVDDLAARFPPLPGGPWPEAPREALVLPVAPAGAAAPAALLVAGVSPRRLLDPDYRAFFESLAAHMATAIATAEAFDRERRRAEELAELDRAKTVFFSNVSHEFRTPLTLMLGPVEDLLAKAAAEAAPEDREALEVVRRNGQRLLKLVNTLLDFARIEAGRAQAAYEPTDLAALTADLASNFRSACERAGLRLVVDCPPAGEAFVDREMWEKVVLNLLSNAFKFTLAGEIGVVLRRTDAGFELAVRDTGVGIPAAALPRMFERFHRVEGAQGRSHEGSGIGLALVQELVKLHGGSLRVVSRLGEGSTFTVSVPAGSAHLPAERIRAPRAPRETGPSAARAGAFVDEALSWLPATGAPAAEARGGDRRVLLADDNADLREYARRLLAESFEVEAVADGEAALAAARRQRPDLVVTDVMMPRLDGFGLIRALRADPALQDVPVVALSARAGEEARFEGLELGADDYLTKPFGARELIVRCETLLRSFELRREAEQALRESEERFRVFANTAPAMLWVTEPDATCTFLSQAWCDFTGQTLAEGLGFGWVDAVHPDDRAATERLFLDANRRHAPFHFDYRLRRADGEYRWAIDAGRPRRGPGGEFLGYIGSVIDVHERRLAEDALRASEERLRLATEAAGMFAWECDVRADTIVWSSNAAQVIGCDPRELPAAMSESHFFVAPDDAARVGAEFREDVRARRETLVWEFRGNGEPGAAKRWAAHARVLYDEAGAPARILGVTQDVTAQRLAQDALRDADRAKDEFLATLSHELRNPLAPLRNSLELLRRAGTDAAAMRSVHDIMERQVEHLVRLVDDLLELSRITRGSFELRREPLELQTVLRNALETAKPAIEAARHAVRVRLPREPLALDADAVRLAQVFANLLNNAAKYTPDGGEIALEARREGRDAVVTVSDTGEGIEPDQIPRLFEMFSQGNRTSRRSQGGLGIGLALARRLVEMHFGTIAAESPGLGRGSRFTVRLPLSPASAPRHPEPTERAERAAPALAPQRVLVVDDNRDAATSLGMLLQCLGAEVRVTHDGPAALAAFDVERPAIVLLDIGMPGMDGYEVARAIRARPDGAHVPLVALTGWGQEEDRRRAKEAGFDHHLVKPADLDALQALLAALPAASEAG